jgi:hypothetical protein
MRTDARDLEAIGGSWPARMEGADGFVAHYGVVDGDGITVI